MNKSQLLEGVSRALASGVITRRELQALLDSHQTSERLPEKPQKNRTSAVDVMFYIAGAVLFAAVFALLLQSWDNGNVTRILLSAGMGTVFWAIATYLAGSPRTGDIQKGFVNALLVAGSLSIITGGFVIASELVDYNDFHFYATAITLATLGSLHLAFGWQSKRDLITLIGVVLAVAAFPALIFGLLSDASVPTFVYWLILAISAGLLAYASRVVSWTGLSSKNAAHAFDPLSAFGVLGSLYAASFDSSTGIIWMLTLIAGIIGLFYLSIVKQDRLMLGNGSLFLVIAIITISSRYFSGYGIATSLFISAIGLIGTAVMAATINRRYMK